MKVLEYDAALRWEGNTGAGTADYQGYERRFRVSIEGKPDLIGSSDPMFRGDPGLHDPEDLLVVALSSCHMLSYLALCARRGVRVIEYADRAHGRMRLDSGGGGRFESVVLRPHVVIADGEDVERAHALHEPAHASCFIASSCNFPVTCEPVVEHEAAWRLRGASG
ncbi:MAG: OsmC family protein [Kofleriaceae bacterium]